MTATDDERREIAAKLRGMHGVIVWDDLARSLGMSPQGSGKTLLDAFADLVEPAPERTCRKVPGKMKYGRRMPACSECGQSLGDDRWFYCPHCGAKVVKR